MKKLNTAAKWLLPPIITLGVQKLLGKRVDRRSSNAEHAPHESSALNLFDNEPNFLEDAITSCKIYGEFGTGESTKFVLKFSDAHVYCIDSDPYWLKIATAGYQESPKLRSKIVDLGKVLSWGVPVGEARHDAFKEYTNWIFAQAEEPDLILIDGRFRVCCFLTALKHLKPGARIIFDDYTHRPQYHFVERFLAPSAIRGRQALFEIPAQRIWNDEILDIAIEAFRFNLN